MSEETVIGEFDTGRNDKIVVSTKSFNGKMYVDIRKFVYYRDVEDFQPTKKGIRFELSLLPHILEILNGIAEDIDAGFVKGQLIKEELEQRQQED